MASEQSSRKRRIALIFGVMGLVAALIAAARAIRQIQQATEDADRESDILQPR